MTEQQHSQGLTRREVIKKGALLGGTVMWVSPVVQMVGMRPALAQVVSDTCVEQFASSVVDSDQGTQINGDPVSGTYNGNNRTNPANAVGNNDNIFSLGFKLPGAGGGFIELEFADAVFASAGSEVVVIETTNNPGSYPEEKADVFVSANGSDWEFVGQASSKNATNAFGFATHSVKFVRIVDQTDPALFNAIPEADAFDVRSVRIECP